jgi:hypothetical protein
MSEEEKDQRIKELEGFIQEHIIDNVYYYHSPLYNRAIILLKQEDDDE